MRHHKANRKFGREKGQRKALIISLARSLVLHGRIKTTEPKAKELRSFVEKMVTRAKNPTVANRRLLHNRSGSAEVTTKLVKDIAPKYLKRNGGYTRIIKMSSHKNDGGKQAVIEFV